MKKIIALVVCFILAACPLMASAATSDWVGIKGGVSGQAFKITSTSDGIQFQGPTDGTSAYYKKPVDIRNANMELKLVKIPGYANGAAGGKPKADSFFVGTGFLNVQKDLNYGNKGTWKGFGVLIFALAPDKAKVEVICNNGGDWKTGATQEIKATVKDGSKFTVGVKNVNNKWTITVNGIEIKGDYSNIKLADFAKNQSYLSVWNNVANEVKDITFAVTKINGKAAK